MRKVERGRWLRTLMLGIFFVRRRLCRCSAGSLSRPVGTLTLLCGRGRGHLRLEDQYILRLDGVEKFVSLNLQNAGFCLFIRLLESHQFLLENVVRWPASEYI